jgi:hypothetical protein
MNMLKYHYLFADRGEEEVIGAPGMDGKIKLTPSREPSASSEAEEKHPSRKGRSESRRGQTNRVYLLHEELAVIDKLKTSSRKAEIESLIRIGLSVKLGKRHADVIVPPLLEATRSEFHGFFDRFLFLIGIIAYKLHQILFIQERLLWLQLGREEEVNRILDDSQTSARVNSTRRTPQINEVIDKLRKEIHGSR